jgi:putative colanic acid biosynthesis glycosyltransferase
MPKLLQINVDSGCFSAGKITEDIATIVIKHGWESYVAYGRDSKPCSSQVIKVGNMLGVYEHYAEFRLLDNEGLASRNATRRLISKIESIKPDIIHLHVLHDHYVNYRVLFSYLRKTNIPIVWTMHDCWSMTGGCMHFEVLKCDKWKSECYDCPEKRAIINRAKRNFRLKNSLFNSIKSLTYVPVSNWLGNYLRQSPQGFRPIKVIHNGIDIDKFVTRSQQTKAKDKFKILGVAAVWTENKGISDFYKLRDILPEKDYDITLVGLSKQQAESLPAGIEGIQRTHNFDELVSLYSNSDVFVNPTYSDNFPTTNIEALACGTPVITYNTGGSPEAIDNKTGIVVPQGNLSALKQAIIEIRNNPLSRDDCRHRAEQLYDKNKCFEQYYELYQELLSDKVTQ